MIQFFSETEDFTLQDTQVFADWLEACAQKHDCEIEDINYIFCDDEYLLAINQKHLNHDYYTDIITFDYCDGNILSGDIFISIDRVSDNAFEYASDFEAELGRVMVHGLLHMIGFKDKTEEQQQQMREKEDECLQLIFSDIEE
ncbi:rRNA maturation RNase YbeY [Ornithobacterium rhinotracheale]|uniref:rRNA maturation RNase YbeY n=1 Tax=Ornithobacterium rhinotracheale TaxID=28251 RepID=UPI00129CA828|nr:rRNA maturation RNase YbeY [Ornithobacterium rhinotracheale]MRJ09561.1 rRNA maturation RNase YbeY [Ornithobacterium rhinotracheale]